jgi:hypothetical protein
MEQSITSLSHEQAQRALMIFYDLLPGDFWEGGKKPSAVKLKLTAEKLQDDAPEDVRPVVDVLLAEGREEEKGEAAKAVLSIFYEQESLRGYVETATHQAQQPHMAPLPLIIGAVIVILAALPKKIDWKNKQYEGGQLRDAAALVKEFGQFAAKLPVELWKEIIKGATGPGGV